MMEPLKVTFSLRAPMLRQDDHPLHLDGVIAYCYAEVLKKEADEDAAAGNPVRDAWAESADLTNYLAFEATPGGEWVWKASRIEFAPLDQIHWHTQIRKTEPESYLNAIDRGVVESRANMINTRSGQHRAYHLLHAYQWMREGTAWCIGDREGIETLLTGLRGLGPQVRNGYGLIDTVTVESCQDAKIRWRRRALPPGMTGDPSLTYYPRQSTLRPSYWNKLSQVEVQEPA